METTTYEVRVLGQIWQPGFHCANELTIAAEDIEDIATQAASESDEAFELRRVQVVADCRLGDFSGIDAWDVRKVRTEREFASWAELDSHGIESIRAERQVIVTRFEQLVSFDEDQEMEFQHAMFGEMDE